MPQKRTRPVAAVSGAARRIVAPMLKSPFPASRGHRPGASPVRRRIAFMPTSALLPEERPEGGHQTKPDGHDRVLLG